MTDFPITANDARIQYVATASQTVFPYDFPIFSQDHLTVTRVRAGVTTTLTITTDYTVSGVGVQAGGNVTLTSGATLSDLITVERDVPAARATDYNEAGDFFATALNQDLDLLVMVDQQIIRDASRSVRLAAEDTLTTLNALPTASARAGQFFTFDSSGQPSVASGASDVPVSSAMAVVVAATSLGAARTALGLGTMATQDATGVAITGGSVSVPTLAGSAITGSTLALTVSSSVPTLGASIITGTSITLTGAASMPTLGASTITAGNISAATAIGASMLTVDTIRIDGSSITTISGDMTISPSATNRVLMRVARAGDVMTLINDGTATPNGFEVAFTGSAPDNNTQTFIVAGDTGAQRFRVDSDGDVKNHDNSYGAISDARLKTKITPASSQWADVKALADRLVNFYFLSDIAEQGEDGAPKMLGFIAQSVLEVSPGLVNESPHATLGTALEVQYSIANLKAFGALGEALARIEALEARVTTLEEA